MPHRVFHIFTRTTVVEQDTYRAKSPFIETILCKLGLIQKVVPVESGMRFAHSVIKASDMQKIIKEQMTLLRMNKLEPFCIFIGSQEYSDLCEYADMHLVQQVSYIDAMHLFEEFHKTVPISQEYSINAKLLELVQHETSDLVNRQIQRLPGSLIVSGYKFLNLPLVILPWLGGVLVAPSLSTSTPNTTLI